MALALLILLYIFVLYIYSLSANGNNKQHHRAFVRYRIAAKLSSVVLVCIILYTAQHTHMNEYIEYINIIQNEMNEFCFILATTLNVDSGLPFTLFFSRALHCVRFPSLSHAFSIMYNSISIRIYMHTLTRKHTRILMNKI